MLQQNARSVSWAKKCSNCLFTFWEIVQFRDFLLQYLHIKVIHVSGISRSFAKDGIKISAIRSYAVDSVFVSKKHFRLCRHLADSEGHRQQMRM